MDLLVFLKQFPTMTVYITPETKFFQSGKNDLFYYILNKLIKFINFLFLFKTCLNNI